MQIDLDVFVNELKEYIAANYSPEDIFDNEKLFEWARQQDIDDITNSKDLEVYIANNYSPEDVFSVKELNEWARENGLEEV